MFFLLSRVIPKLFRIYVFLFILFFIGKYFLMYYFVVLLIFLIQKLFSKQSLKFRVDLVLNCNKINIIFVHTTFFIYFLDDSF